MIPSSAAAVENFQLNTLAFGNFLPTPGVFVLGAGLGAKYYLDCVHGVFGTKAPKLKTKPWPAQHAGQTGQTLEIDESTENEKLPSKPPTQSPSSKIIQSL